MGNRELLAFPLVSCLQGVILWGGLLCSILLFLPGTVLPMESIGTAWGGPSFSWFRNYLFFHGLIPVWPGADQRKESYRVSLYQTIQ
jgi:hypothetical protein